jgi:hypothetical protein
MIRELREENTKLKLCLVKYLKGETPNLKELGIGDISELIENMDEDIKAIEDMQKPWTEKLNEEKERDRLAIESKPANQENRRVPHLTNLNEDPQLTGKVYYSLLDCKISNLNF